MKYNHPARRRVFGLLLALCLLCGLAAGCGKTESAGLPMADAPTTRYSFEYLDTYIYITIYNEVEEDVFSQCFDIIASYEERCSRTLTTTEIYTLNTTGSATVEDDIVDMLKIGQSYGDLTGGVFDITIQPVTSLWDFTSGAAVIPDADELAEAAKHTDYHNLVIDGNDVTLTDPDSGVDLGGIAKGYIADRLRDYLVSVGVTSAIIYLGGDIQCIGSKPDGSPFRIGVQVPFGASDSYAARVQATDKSIVTSGIYERYFEVDGVLYHHILNPDTGYPYETDLLSATVISDDSVDGDCVATTCIALGLEDALDFVDGLDGIYAILITDDNEIYYSEGCEAYLYND